MAYFAELDENNIVLRVIAVDNKMLIDNQGQESEQVGIDFCTSLFGGRWLQTSYNTCGNTHSLGKTPFRKNYAGIGFVYDTLRDAFIAPKPTENAIFNEETCVWTVPYQIDQGIGVTRV